MTVNFKSCENIIEDYRNYIDNTCNDFKDRLKIKQIEFDVELINRSVKSKCDIFNIYLPMLNDSREMYVNCLNKINLIITTSGIKYWSQERDYCSAQVEFWLADSKNTINALKKSKKKLENLNASTELADHAINSIEKIVKEYEEALKDIEMPEISESNRNRWIQSMINCIPADNK